MNTSRDGNGHGRATVTPLSARHLGQKVELQKSPYGVRITDPRGPFWRARVFGFVRSNVIEFLCFRKTTPGAKLAVLAGNPSKAGPFTIRAQVPAGYKVAPHWYPGDENLTVLSGTVALGMGETWDDSKLQTTGPGGYVGLPATMRHFFLAKSASTFQVHGMGPFSVNYVNPADDPNKK
jgi:hypothetical protein